MESKEGKKKSGGCLWLAIAAIVVFMLFCGSIPKSTTVAGNATSTTDTTYLTPEQESQAQDLAARSLVSHADGTSSPMSIKQARIAIEDCSMLKDTKFSNMTPQMLSVWETCKGHGLDH
ncbi:MAG TPA: hypothetical protein VIX19_11715 [Terriglobales bacterium]